MGHRRWQKRVGPVDITKVSVGPMDNNVYVIAVGDEAAVVDGGSNEADFVLELLGNRRLAAILQTHGHRDHVVALREVVDATGAPVFAHADDHLPAPAQKLQDGDAHEVGGIALKVIHTPGHSPGSVCFLLEEAGEHHLFAGDTLFPGGPGNTFGDAKAFQTIMRSLDEKLFVLPDDTHVYPGHGDDTTIGNERSHVEEWRERGW